MTLHLLQTLIHHYDNRERVSHGSQLNMISVGGKFNFPSCSHSKLLLAVVSRAESDPDSRILHAGSPQKKITESESIRKAERKTWRSKWQLSLRLHATFYVHSDIM